jgi:membrane-associated phospholipid phosphatase
VAVTGAVAVASLTSKGRGRDLDRRLYRALNTGRGPAADAFFKAVTELGSIWASGAGAAAIARSGRKRTALDALGAGGAMWLLGQWLKRLYLRPRPYQALDEVRLLIPEPRGSSWPSSHPAVLLAFLAVATRDLDVPGPVRAAAADLCAIVGLSRVYLGVHYPADVAGGVLVAIGLADLWSATISPLALGRRPCGTVPDTVSE